MSSELSSAPELAPAPEEEKPGPPPWDERLVAGFLLANGLVTLVVAAFDAARDLPPTIGAAPIDLLLALLLARGMGGAVPLARLRLVVMLAMGSWAALRHGDVPGGLRTALFAVPAYVLLARSRLPWLRAVLRAVLVPTALLLTVDVTVAVGDLWFPVGTAEYGNRFIGPPVTELEGNARNYRLPLPPGRWRAYRPEYLLRFVSSADRGVVDPATGDDVLVFVTDGALVESDPEALHAVIEESLQEGSVKLEVDSLERLRPGPFDEVRVATVHGSIGNNPVQGYVGFYVREDFAVEVWAVGDPGFTTALAPELREIAGALELPDNEP